MKNPISKNTCCFNNCDVYEIYVWTLEVFHFPSWAAQMISADFSFPSLSTGYDWKVSVVIDNNWQKLRWSIRCDDDEDETWCLIFALCFFRCPEQLNRWPCHWVTESLTQGTLLIDIQRATQETCDLWDIWLEWWGDMNWPKKDNDKDKYKDKDNDRNKFI